jgi:predicted MPP superfamily phosphohydrolase
MSAAVGTLARWRALVVLSFFGNAFDLLFFATSMAQWVVLWWVVPRVVNSFPLALQMAGPLALYGMNRWLMARTQRRGRARLPVSRWQRVYYAVAFTSLFCAGFLLCIGTLWGVAKLFLGAIAAQAWTGRAGVVTDFELELIFRWLGNTGLAAIGLTFAYGYSIGQRRLQVTRLVLPLGAASAALDGLRIAQISDIHIGQNLNDAELEGFVARVNDLDPDLVCITGDIADSPSADLDGCLPLLARLHARYGVFAILGNHDHYAGADHVEAALRRLTPFTVLRDERTTIDVNGDRLHIIGLDDRGHALAHGVPHVSYLDATMASVPRDESVLLLCHRPDIFRQAAAAGVALTLAGHTHGGQLGVPWLKGRVRNLAEFVTAFDRGLFEHDGSYLYVNRGLGVTAQRIRLNAPREITLIEVRAAGARALAA